MRLNFNATIDTMNNITLPPLPLPKLPPLPVVLPKLPVRRPAACHAGDGFVQVMLDVPDDVAMRLMMVAEGVEFIAGSMVPKTGTLFFAVAPGGKIRYCWRA